jgi:hypothetical protein
VPSARRSRLVIGAGTALVVAALVSPMAADAHGLIQRANLPIPEWLFGWAAAVVLVVSFLALALLWPQPRLEGSSQWRPLAGIGRILGSGALETACQLIGALLFALVLAAGFFGSQEVQQNFTPTFIFITFWVGIALASVLFGDVFRAFNPWRAIGRATGWVVTRARGGRPLAHVPYPERLGRWPATTALVGFAWLELASGAWSKDPSQVALAVLVYSIATFATMAVYGVGPWIENGEGFSVYFNLLSRISIFERRDGVVGVRPPLSALTELERKPGTVAVVVVMIGTVTFDGLSQGSVWARTAQHTDKWFDSLGFSPDAVARLSNTLGIGVGLAIVAGFYALGVAGARTVGGDLSVERLRRAFVHSLIPIAMVYVAAHYLTFFIFEGQQIFALASDPFGKGWNLFGTAGDAINFGLISQNQTWYLQVAVVVAGHVAALVLAHERALILYDKPKLAVRSQYWMLGVMVGFTSMALWLLAQAGTALNVSEASSIVTPGRSSRLVDFSKKPPFVNGLEIDPVSKDFLLTTNRGFWRIDPKTKKVTRIRGTISYQGKSDTVGTFLLVYPVSGRHLIGSGHPDHQNTLPQFLGYIESQDGGKTWKALARMGDADLHKIVFRGSRMYAYDAVISALLTSDDFGRSFKEHFAPRGLILDFAVDPQDRDYILADNDDQIFRSSNGGNSWQPIITARHVRLAWPAPGYLYRADQNGKIYTSQDRGRTWGKVSTVVGEPYKFKPFADPRHLDLALSDGTILETTDGARTWKELFKP